MIRPLIAGNWKMNGLRASLETAREVERGLSEFADKADCLLCPPATLLKEMSQLASSGRLAVGGQDCHPADAGAHTGDVSAAMIADAGGAYVILGHSERRSDHAETSEMVCQKASAAFRAGLTPIVCVGETLAEREQEQTLEIVGAQLRGSVPDEGSDTLFIVAYEPVWAIGTGKVATPEQVEAVHTFIRNELTKRFGNQGAATPILYGGSMKPGNAAELLSVTDVNGGLIGGASLKAEDFLAIYSACIDLL
ncbi:MAG: triose-phosphate isomerase [Henriciella sp.]|uniref:triose-phosphate isomerase n=1 Tax=Henriciella sp. TaxID=1968823 RepID=UPI003C749BA5